MRGKASNGVKFNESLPVGRNEQLLSARDLHFTKDQSQMSANSRFLNEQPFRDLFVFKTLREGMDDLKFSGGQAPIKPYPSSIIASGRRPIADQANGGLRRSIVHGSWSEPAE